MKANRITNLFITFAFLCVLLAFTPLVAQIKTNDFVLTAEDSVWLQSKKFTLRFGIHPYWPPIDYIDENGKHVGLNSEYIKLFSESTGITIEYVINETWTRQLESIKNKETDFIASIDYTKQRDEFLLFTPPYIEIPNFYISNTTYASKKNKDLSSAAFALVSDYSYLDKVKNAYPKASFIYFNKDISALVNTSFGISDICILDMPSVTHLVNKYGIANITVLSETDFPWQIRMAVNKSEPQLQSILNRFLASIPPSSTTYLHDKYLSKFTFEQDKNFTFILYFILFALLISFIILSISFFYNSRLKKQIAEKTKALKETNDRYGLTISSTFDSIFDFNLTHGTIRFETGFFNLFEFESKTKTFAFAEWRNFVIPEDQEEVKENFKLLSETQLQNWNCKFRIKTKNDTVKWISLNGIVTYSDLGAPIRIFGAIKDISDSSLIQQQLDAEQINTEALINNTSDLIWSVTNNLNLITANSPFYDVVKAIIGKQLKSGDSVKDLFRVLPVSEREIWMSYFDRAFTGESFTTEVHVPSYNGMAEQWAELSFYPIFEQEFVHSIALHYHDITEKTIHLKAIEEQNNRLKEVTWMQAHIVRAPLSRLLTIIELIKSYPDSLTEQDRIEMIANAAGELDEIVTDISNKAEAVTNNSRQKNEDNHS